MGALFNVDPKEFADNGKTFLQRYGARPNWDQLNEVSGELGSHREEFFFACFIFMKNWTLQYTASIGLTFMPEMYPGMLACYPHFGLQGYLTQVTHTWDLSDESGFKTTIDCTPWSTIGKDTGIIGLPIGADL